MIRVHYLSIIYIYENNWVMINNAPHCDFHFMIVKNQNNKYK